MKKLLSAVLLVAVIAVTGCGDSSKTKKTDTKPATGENKPAETK
jgi:uncharacterized lipoprotein YehR (DUF1307 family)